MPLSAVLFVLLFSRSVSPSEWRQLFLGASITAFPWTMLYPGILDAMHNARYWRATLAASPDVASLEKEFIAEYAHMKEALGVEGQMPQTVRLGYFLLILYFGLFYGMFAHVIIFFPALGDLTVLPFAVVAIPLYLSAWFLMLRYSKRMIEEARARGFRLPELHAEIVSQRRARFRFPWFPRF